MCIGLSGRRDQSLGRRRRDVGSKAALSRLPKLRQRVPVWSAEVPHPDAPSDEMRHVLRPFIRRTEADVRERLSDGRDLVRKV